MIQTISTISVDVVTNRFADILRSKLIALIGPRFTIH